MANVWTHLWCVELLFQQEVFKNYVTGRTHNCPLIRQGEKLWAVKCCITYTANYLMKFASQFPHDHVSGRAVDTTHIPTLSYMCLLIITTPHQRSLMHNTIVCKPNVGNHSQGTKETTKADLASLILASWVIIYLLL